jgi:hypothetical protein
MPYHWGRCLHRVSEIQFPPPPLHYLLENFNSLSSDGSCFILKKDNHIRLQWGVIQKNAI